MTSDSDTLAVRQRMSEPVSELSQLSQACSRDARRAILFEVDGGEGVEDAGALGVGSESVLCFIAEVPLAIR